MSAFTTVKSFSSVDSNVVVPNLLFLKFLIASPIELIHLCFLCNHKSFHLVDNLFPYNVQILLSYIFLNLVYVGNRHQTLSN